MKTQFGTAQSADFEENTWTFEMQGEFTVCAGEFAIVPKDDYDALLVKCYEAINALKTVVKCTDKGEFAEAVITAEKILNPTQEEQDIFNSGGIDQFFQDMEEYENQIYCNNCGNDSAEVFKFSRSVSNGTVFYCHDCKQEKLIGKKPNEDDY